MILAIIVLLAVGMIFYAGIAFNKNNGGQTAFEKQTTAEKAFSIIILIVMLAGCGALGLMAAGDFLPLILVAFLLFFLVCIYTAKEERAKQYSILKEMNKKLKKMEEDIATLKEMNEIRSKLADDVDTGKQNSNSEQI